MDILIFKTNINSPGDFNLVRNGLNENHDVKECTIDFQDRDKVLRVISDKLTVRQVEKKLGLLGFYCRELND